MISVAEARQRTLAHVLKLESESVRLEAASGRFLAEDVIAPNGHPLFDMSAVDGYALGSGSGPWTLVGSIAAGQSLMQELRNDECARIFTGAMVPAACRAVLMQEHAEITSDGRINSSKPLADGANIRRENESFAKGARLLSCGQLINPEHIGLLASCGLDRISVGGIPRVGIIRTGGEFVNAGKPAIGRIYPSNERMLIAAITSGGLRTKETAFVAEDDPSAIRSVIVQAIEEGELVITTGGVSVGDHDHVHDVLRSLGATIHFHGVKQKPGKPMLFATIGGKPVFALPGNPRAVMVCWHVYVLPYLRAMQGATNPERGMDRLPLASASRAKGDRMEFRAATIRGGQVHLLADEGSHMLASLAEADALALIPEGTKELSSGDMVEFFHLPRG